MIVWLEFEGNVTIIAILVYLRNPTVVSIVLQLEISANLTIVPILFYLRNLTVVSMIVWLDFEGNLTIIAILIAILLYLRNPKVVFNDSLA